MSKEKVLANFNHYYMDEWKRCLDKGMSEEQTVEYFHDCGWISDYEYRIFNGEDLPYPFINNKIDINENKSDSFLTESNQLNDALGGSGIEVGNLVVVQAPTGEGKTTMMMRMALNAAHQGKRVAYISLGEQTAQELSIRFACMIQNREYKGVYKEKYSENDLNYITNDYVSNKLSNINIIYDEKLDLLETIIEQGYKFIFIDYLGCLFPDDARTSQYIYLTEKASYLKNLATEKNICIITAMQTNRALLTELSANPDVNPMTIDETFMADSVGVARKATICMTWITLKGMKHLVLYKNRCTGKLCDIQISVEDRTYKWNELYKPEAGF